MMRSSLCSRTWASAWCWRWSMSCPRPVGALGRGTLSTALVVGRYSSLPPAPGRWGLAGWAGPEAWPQMPTSHQGLHLHLQGGCRALLITRCHVLYLASNCFSFKMGRVWGMGAENIIPCPTGVFTLAACTEYSGQGLSPALNFQSWSKVVRFEWLEFNPGLSP